MKRLTVTIKDFEGDFFFYFDETETGYKCNFPYKHWSKENETVTHEITITQTAPLGRIYFELDAVGAGCWDSGTFNGVAITERDLQWCAHWGLSAIRHKNASLFAQERLND